MSGLDILGLVFDFYAWLFANPIMFIVLYLLPIILAFLVKHKNRMMIVILGLLFGWIFLLWLILIFWAMFGEKVPRTSGNNASPMTESKPNIMPTEAVDARDENAQ